MKRHDWWIRRREFYDRQDTYEHEVSIAVIGYNRLEEKTKFCVDSILKYTDGIDYQLILVDSGSFDGTDEFLESVDHKDKTVIRLENNLGLSYALSCAWKRARGRFLAFVANDCIVTEHWLDNLLTAIRSDPRIGMVCPAVSNVSNAQSICIGEYSNWDEMQLLAAKHNVSNPMLWEYRPRLINPVALYRSEVLDLIGYMDPGFTHNFGEDDIARGIHRNGYRMLLCKDTYVEHNHPQTERDMEEQKVDIEEGKRVFLEKYHGIEPWEDINNYILPYLGGIDRIDTDRNEIHVLGVEIRCGTPFLDVLNKLRMLGISEASVCFNAYTDDVKYYTDLEAYPAEVTVGKTSVIREEYPDASMDIVVTTKDINEYLSPEVFLQDACSLLYEGGYVLFPLKNTCDVLYYMDCMLGQRKSVDRGAVLSCDVVLEQLEKLDAEQVWITDERYQEQLKEVVFTQLGDSFSDFVTGQGVTDLDELFVERYWFLVKMK